MALSTATVTLDISDLLGNDFDARRTKVWATTNVPGNTLIDATGDKIRLGSGTVTLAADGTASLVVWVPGTGSNPASWQTSIHVDYPDRNAPGGRATKTFGPFTITGNANLADLVAEMPVQPEYEALVLAQVQEMIDEATNDTGPAITALASRVDGYVDHGSISGAQTFNGPTGSHWFDATAATTITLSGFSDGQVVSLLCFSGAEDVTVAGLPDLELADGLVVSAIRARGVWVTGGGGGTPAVPDTTPPSAVTDLSATGGEGQIVLNWSDATDAENAVSYRYRVWPTSGGASGTWTTTTTSAATITGLAAGAYTAEVYAYSAGGASATDTATATVTAVPGWSVLASDDFTGTDGTAIHGRNTPVGGITWVADPTNVIGGNKVVVQSGTVDYAGFILPLAAASSASGVEIKFDTTLVQQANSQYPFVNVDYPNTPTLQLARTGASALEVRVIGYNAASTAGQTLAGPVAVTSSTAITFRKAGNVVEILEGSTVVLTHDLVGGYSGYIGQPTPNSVNIVCSKFTLSSFDTFVARVLS